MIGAKLAQFEITAKLGEGGMGAVYRAKDTNLGREVAIKVLPEAFTADPERLARFEREAKVLASVSHPNIAGIYDLARARVVGGKPAEGEAAAGEEIHFLVLELAAGHDLAQRLAAGPISLEDALPIARQVAEALESAHRSGIVHRDLKPANIMLGPDGKVKVLDFGLAKAWETDTENPNLTQSPTLTANMTRAGVILGTASYMSPEQARGQEADQRSDVFSFGVVLHEMLTGKRLFDAGTVSDTLAHVLMINPEWDELAPQLPAPILRLLRRCLEKDPKLRLQAIGEARIAIDEYLADPDAAVSGPVAIASEPAAIPSWLKAMPLVAAVLLVGLGVALWAPWRGATPEATPKPVVRFTIPPAVEGEMLGMPDQFAAMAISPEGSRLAFIATDEDLVERLYLRDLDKAEPTMVLGSERARSPFFSPDGKWIAFFTPRYLMKASVEGGLPLQIAEAGQNRGGNWGDDGRIYFTPDTEGGVVSVSANGGEVREVTTLDAERIERTHRWPQVLPESRAVIYTNDTAESTEFYDDARIDVVDLSDGSTKTLIEGSSMARYISSGHLVFARSGSLFAVPFDLDKLEVTGEQFLVLQGIDTIVNSGIVHFDVARDGTLIYVAGSAQGEEREMVWVSPDGGVEKTSLTPGIHQQIALSPDERSVALTTGGAQANDLWNFDLERGTLSRLTFEGTVFNPVWTPDGVRIAFALTTGGQMPESYWKLADGSAPAEQLTESEYPVQVESISSDGAWLLADVITGPSSSSIFAMPLDGSGNLEPWLHTDFDEWHSQFSPDGKWVAYASVESGEFQIYVRPFPGPGGKWQISTGRGIEPKWSRDGRALYYRSAGRLFRVPIDTSSGFRAGTPEELPVRIGQAPFPMNYAVASDGRILTLVSKEDRDRAGEITVVLNWADEVARMD